MNRTVLKCLLSPLLLLLGGGRAVSAQVPVGLIVGRVEPAVVIFAYCREGSRYRDAELAQDLLHAWPTFQIKIKVELVAILSDVAARSQVDVIASKLEFVKAQSTILDLTPQLLDAIGATDETRRLTSVLLRLSSMETNLTPK